MYSHFKINLFHSNSTGLTGQLKSTWLHKELCTSTQYYISMATLPNIFHYFPSYVVQQHKGNSHLCLHSKHTTVTLHPQCLSCLDILFELWVMNLAHKHKL